MALEPESEASDRQDVVFITALPSEMMRSIRRWNDLSYLDFGLDTWTRWCRKNGARLHVFREPLYPDLLPTYQRYAAFELLERAGIRYRRIALVDADTMVRWDAPNIFDAAEGRMGVVHDHGYPWIFRSIRAFAPLFPGPELDPFNYFNSGVVIVDEQHRSFFGEVIDWYRTHTSELEEVMRRAAYQVGTDQTPFNFLVRRANIPITGMSPAFNFQNCVTLTPRARAALNDGPSSAVAREALDADGMLDFMSMAYVWHFNGEFPGHRFALMRDVWRRIEARYEGLSTVDPALIEREPEIEPLGDRAFIPGPRSKIFSIGFNKTGSMPIHELLLALGLRAYHGASWWTEEDPAFFDAYDCFSDGIPGDFMRFDREFPQSRFILLVRDLDSWISSRIQQVRRTRPGPDWDDTDPTISKWIKRRNEHHRAVLSHFARRPGDLLVVNFFRDPAAPEKVRAFLGRSPASREQERPPVPSPADPPDPSTARILRILRAMGALPSELKNDLLVKSLIKDSESLPADTSEIRD